jgi:OOP family OmpA-OmpF porin
VVNLPDILFEFGAARLTGEAQRNVSDITEILNKEAGGRQISVEGHTDSVGSFSFNQDLSERRANSVARELEYNGVPRNKIRSRGYGESRPIASNNSDQGRARNRRVEVIVEN